MPLESLNPPQTPSASFASEPVLGRTEPRLWTPPLVSGPPGPCGCGCALTPETSVGFDQDDFARYVLRQPLDPWQRWVVIHAGELLPDGKLRFSIVLVLVARQNGKTELLVVLSAYWMFVDAVPLVLGMSTKTEMARESWDKMIKLVQRTPGLDHLRSIKKWYKTGAGSETAETLAGSRYKITAANDSGGRGMTIHRLIMDELRHHDDYEAWDAAVPAGSAASMTRYGFQAWGISNAGTDSSVVLNEQRELALKFIETGEGDGDTALFEWSAPEGSDLLDVNALAQANPNLGRRIPLRTILGWARAAKLGGTAKLAGFKTEHMCVHIKSFDSAVDHEAWAKSFVEGDLRPLDKSRIAFCLDVSPDNQHATLAAAAVLADDRVRVEVVKAWEGVAGVESLRRELRSWIDRRKPQTLGYLPNGPAAALVADLRERKGRYGWPPPGVTLTEIGSEVSAVCMGFAQQVGAGQVVHDNNDLLNDHVRNANKLFTGDVWRFSRKKGEGNCDAAYAAAGALHLARTLPTPPGDFVIMLAKQA